MSDIPTNPKRFQFSVRALVYATVLCAVVLAAIRVVGLDLTIGFSGFTWSCAFVVALLFAIIPFGLALSKIPYWTALLLAPAFYYALNLIFFLFGAAIDEPNPWRSTQEWFEVNIRNAHTNILEFVVGATVVILIDGFVQRHRPRDRAYYPRISSLRQALKSFRARMLLYVGVATVLIYYGDTVITMWCATHLRRAGLYWPSPRVFVTCNLLWAVLWVVDCLSRPRGGTIVAALGYLCLSLIGALLVGFSVVLE